MSFLGFYTKKEIQEIETNATKNGYADGVARTQVVMKKEINKLKDEHLKKIDKIQKEYGSLIGNILADQTEVERKLECKESEIYVLRTVLALETDKEVKRLECIAKRTKKPRIAKKCENRIINYKMKKLAYEPK